MGGIYSPDLSTQRTTWMRWLLGGLTSTGSFTSLMCVSRFRSTIADLPLQIELAINTHVMVLDIHRNVATGQRGTDNQHHSVSVTSYSSIIEYSLSPRLKPGRLFRIPWSPCPYFSIGSLSENCLPHHRGPVSGATS